MPPDAVVDLPSGTLRLRRSVLLTLATLSDPAAADSADPDAVATLRSINLVHASALSPDVAPVAAAIRNPLLNLELEILGPDQALHCPGWVDGNVAVLAVPGSDGLDDVKVAPTGHLVARLGAFLGLGPRPRQTTGQHLEGNSVRLHWRITILWANGGAQLEIIDASENGLWRISRDREGTVVDSAPASSTDVWRWLGALFPEDTELGLPAADGS